MSKTEWKKTVVRNSGSECNKLTNFSKWKQIELIKRELSMKMKTIWNQIKSIEFFLKRI